MKREDEPGYVPAGPGDPAAYPLWVKVAVAVMWLLALAPVVADHL